MAEQEIYTIPHMVSKGGHDAKRPIPHSERKRPTGSTGRAPR